jgi:hypothetical protein
MRNPKISGDGALYTDRMMLQVWSLYETMRDLQRTMWGHEIEDNVLAMHDHESTLTVTWSKKPEAQEILMMGQAWRAAETPVVLHCWPTAEPIELERFSRAEARWVLIQEADSSEMGATGDAYL